MKRHAMLFRSEYAGLGTTTALVALGALLAGCGTQVGEDYLGEALLTLRGSVVVDNPEAPRDLVPVLAFERPREGALPNGYLIEDVEHTGDFPARFRLGVYEPPPARARFSVSSATGGSATYAWGYVGAVAPEHPAALTQTNTFEWSYCLGRECYTDRSRCDDVDACYYERKRCSLPAWFDAQGPRASDCREVARGGDIATVPVSRTGYGIQQYGSCVESPCQVTYEWCGDGGTACVERPDGACTPAPGTCFSRTIECQSEAVPRLPPELNDTRWPERTDLSDCSIVSQQGNLEYAENPNEWLAGLSDDVVVVYLEDGFDAAAFEQATGVVAPEHAGYSVFALEPWNDTNMAAYTACSDQVTAAVFEAYNREHGTSFTIEESVDASTPLGEAALVQVVRCSLKVRGSWRPDAAQDELTLTVDLPLISP